MNLEVTVKWLLWSTLLGVVTAQDDTNGSNSGAIAIIVGAIVGITILVATCAFCVTYRKESVASIAVPIGSRDGSLYGSKHDTYADSTYQSSRYQGSAYGGGSYHSQHGGGSYHSQVGGGGGSYHSQHGGGGSYHSQASFSPPAIYSPTIPTPQSSYSRQLPPTPSRRENRRRNTAHESHRPSPRPSRTGGHVPPPPGMH